METHELTKDTDEQPHSEGRTEKHGLTDTKIRKKTHGRADGNTRLDGNTPHRRTNTHGRTDGKTQTDGHTQGNIHGRTDTQKQTDRTHTE